MYKITFRDIIVYYINRKEVNAQFSMSQLLNSIIYNEYIDEDPFDLVGVNIKSFNQADDDYNLLSAIYGRYSDEIVYYASSKINNENEEHKLKLAKFLNKLLDVYQYVSDKYITLLTYYGEKRNSLLDGIKVITDSINKFNDTPVVEGSYLSDNFVTNISSNKTTLSNEKDTLIMRLAEIQDHYKEVYKDFINEFKRIFITNMED